MVSWSLVHFRGPVSPLQVQVVTKGTEKTKALSPLLLSGPASHCVSFCLPSPTALYTIRSPSPAPVVTVSLACLMPPCSPSLPLLALFPL